MAHEDNWQQRAWQQPNPGSQAFRQQAPGMPGYAQTPYGAPWAPQAQPAPKRRGWIVALVAVILFFLLMFFGMASCTNMLGSAAGSISSSPASELDGLAGDAVGVIAIDGSIQYDGTTSSPEGLKAQLDRAESNPHIKAIVLRVNSGGGYSAAGEEMTEYLKEFSKPVVVSCASTNASAAYEISSQADYIFAAKSSAVGSIGAMMQVKDISELLDKLGIKMDNITSAESKDSSYGTRSLTEEERARYQDMVNQINEVFIQNVADGRHMSVEEVRALATGMTFTGMEAVENGLVDEIGTKEDAIAKAAELGGALSGYTVVNLRPEQDSLSSLMTLLSEDHTDFNGLDDILKELKLNGSL